MTKEEYLNQLKMHLNALTQDELTEALQYYSDYFEEANDVDVNSIKLEIEKLKVSIERREKLLSNENYVNKAPQNIVMLDKEKFQED